MLTLLCHADTPLSFCYLSVILPLLCHSERSEESLFDQQHTKEEFGMMRWVQRDNRFT